ncbi:MAG TPA: DUF655 domain-containing protein [Isosphaeraceae bacterium]|nr:DUF655 domain-containing protein [Isosphaeraceae bacterium]
MKNETPTDPHRASYTRVWISVVLLFAVSLIGLTSGEGVPPSVSGHPADFRLDPNVAEAGLLEILPGLGPARVQAILEERQKAPFRSLEEFQQRVKGIGPASSARLKPHLRFPPSPLP